ncbi:MAG: transcription elongation factor GreA [Bacteroidota bacterium]
MSKQTSYYTKEGLDRLTKELLQLKTKGRAEIARQIAEARDKGDLSENAEYDAAKDAQGHLEAKIAKLEDLLSYARLLDETKIDTSVVSIFSRVTIKNKKNGASFTYMLVSEEEADLKAMKISTQSPIGRGLLGKKKGELASIKTPAGEIEIEIINIEV